MRDTDWWISKTVYLGTHYEIQIQGSFDKYNIYIADPFRIGFYYAAQTEPHDDRFGDKECGNRE